MTKLGQFTIVALRRVPIMDNESESKNLKTYKAIKIQKSKSKLFNGDCGGSQHC